jgi:hypothetical protein
MVSDSILYPCRGQTWNVSCASWAEAFSAYAIASSMGLVPEMENAARLTLGLPDDIRIPWRRVAVIQRTGTVRPG